MWMSDKDIKDMFDQRALTYSNNTISVSYIILSVLIEIISLQYHYLLVTFVCNLDCEIFEEVTMLQTSLQTLFGVYTVSNT